MQKGLVSIFKVKVHSEVDISSKINFPFATKFGIKAHHHMPDLWQFEIAVLKMVTEGVQIFGTFVQISPPPLNLSS